MSPLITMVVPYYRQPRMLAKQIETWANYSTEALRAFRFIVVDDCSPDPASSTIMPECPAGLYRSDIDMPQCPASLYRIDKDVPWNRGMARNLGTKEATTPWVLHVDTDHVLPPDSAAQLADHVSDLPIKRWYRFRRYRVGKADETRRKDKIPDAAEFGEIKPHIDSYLCTKEAYWQAGGYNEDFSGVLGGGSPFLAEMVKAHGEPNVLTCPLHVHTRHSVPDSSESTLSRDPIHFANRKRDIMAAHGTLRGHHPLRLPWHRVF